MEEKNETGEPRRYTWPRIVLAGVVFWILLAVIWMSVLVHRTREQRDTMHWPIPKPAPLRMLPQTNSVSSKTNAGVERPEKPGDQRTDSAP
ncbi:MAG TPA: hypothetical protein VN873_18355 [Candidatus Angelobacter sp.]|nr:hypothetical protein [Candidatus Angelobacter sp.]